MGQRTEGTGGAPPSPQVETLKDLARALVRAVEAVEADTRGGVPAESVRPIDFAAAVRRFETGLLLWALAQTGGHQRRAAELLGMNVTTLNSKILRYGIRPRRAAGTAGDEEESHPSPP